MKFDHLGLVVKNLARGRAALIGMLGIAEWSDEFTDLINGVLCQFGRDRSGLFYELLEPVGPSSPLAAALANRRAILNHVAYLVDDLGGAGGRLEREGCAPAGAPKPAVAYDGRLIQFFVTPLNFVIELIEAPDHQHKLRPHAALPLESEPSVLAPAGRRFS